MEAEYSDFLWLTTPEGQAWIRKAAEDKRSLAQLLRVLRKDLSARRAALVVEQVILRQRASEKFPWAHVMLFTRKGLEQATDAWIGGYKARRFPPGGFFADLCCGLGGDLLCLACCGEVHGVEKDPVAALFARANLENVAASLGVGSQAKIFVDDVCNWSEKLDRYVAWHIDPDRRVGGRRTAQLHWSSPSPEVVKKLVASNTAAALKLAPAASCADLCAEATTREWISFRGRCRQQVLWIGPLATAARAHIATVIESEGDPLNIRAEQLVGRPEVPVPITAKIESYIFDPVPSVLASHLVGQMCHQFKLHALSTHGGYLTGEHVPNTRLLLAYRVEEVLPYDQGKLRRWAKTHQVGEVIVKKRSRLVDEARLTTLLRTKGTKRIVVVIAECAGRLWAVVCQPVVGQGF